MNRTANILAAVGLLVLPFVAAAPAKAQQVTIEQFLEVCPDIHARACPDAARSFVATRTPGAETDEAIRAITSSLEVSAALPYVSVPMCRDMSFRLSILADAAARYRLERDVRDTAEHLCEGTEDDEIAATTGGDDDGDEPNKPNEPVVL